MKERPFGTTSISTAAALLSASEHLEFVGLRDKNGKKEILISPFSEARRLYRHYQSGELVINAADNSNWVHQLKNEIFNQKGEEDDQ